MEENTKNNNLTESQKQLIELASKQTEALNKIMLEITNSFDEKKIPSDTYHNIRDIFNKYLEKREEFNNIIKILFEADFDLILNSAIQEYLFNYFEDADMPIVDLSNKITSIIKEVAGNECIKRYGEGPYLS